MALLGKHGQPLGRQVAPLGKHGQPLGRQVALLGKHIKPLGRQVALLGKHGQLFAGTLLGEYLQKYLVFVKILQFLSFTWKTELISILWGT